MTASSSIHHNEHGGPSCWSLVEVICVLLHGLEILSALCVTLASQSLVCEELFGSGVCCISLSSP